MPLFGVSIRLETSFKRTVAVTLGNKSILDYFFKDEELSIFKNGLNPNFHFEHISI